MTPRIGERRIYADGVIPMLYPGEVAHVYISPAEIAAAMDRGEREITVRKILVEPMPGWRGWWLRMRYRLLWSWR